MFEYEALVGHLYIVGGRSISVPPPGALVEVAPRKAARGREADTFFTLILPSGETNAPAAFYEQMCRLGAERYFSSSGSVTSGLRSVFNSLNEDLYEHNTSGGKHYEASILCAVLRGSDLYLGKVGSGVALLRSGDDTVPFPTDFSNDEALFGPPLGVQPVPDPKMARFEVSTGTRLILSDAALADAEMDRLTVALAATDIAALLVVLKDVVGSAATLLAVEFVPPEVPVPLPVRAGESTAELAGGVVKPAPPPSPTRPAAARERQKRPSAVEVTVQEGLSKTALGAAKALELSNRALDKAMPPLTEGKRSWWTTPTAALVTIVVPLAVVIAVIILWVSGTGESEFELCVRDTQERAALARSIASSDVAGTIAAWNAVIAGVDQCNTIRAGDATLAALTREARSIIDRLLSIERRDALPIAAFPNAGLEAAVLQGEDLYVLDNTNDLVYRVSLTSDGRSVVPNTQQAIPSMRRGATVNEFSVGDLFDIAWAEDGSGLTQGNVLLALDRSGVLVECPPRFVVSCEAQRLLATETWSAPIAFNIWQGRLYVLDPSANQIWRYEPAGGSFSNAPTEYFVGTGRPDIRGAVDFGIDDNGSVYLLFGTGILTKFTGGEPQAFAFASFPEGQTISSANAMFLNTNPIAQDIYIISSDSRTIYQTTLAGTFISSYRAFDETMFASLAGVAVDASQKVVYALSGNSILAFERTQPVP